MATVVCDDPLSHAYTDVTTAFPHLEESRVSHQSVSVMASDEESPRPKRVKRRDRRLLFIVLGVIVALVVGVAAVAANYGKSAIDGLDEIRRDDTLIPTGTRPEPIAGDQAPLNIVLMGSDTRGSERGRSDVLQVLHISGDRKNVFLISIPRDSWVDIPGRQRAKINAAYSWGGPALTVETLEKLFDVPMDHTAIIDFEGFVKVIDALGGVTVVNNEASSNLGFDFPKGEINLNGEAALAFVRERYGLSDGDFGRATRQRDVVKSVIGKVASAGTLSDPTKFRETVVALGSSFTVDSGLTNDAIVDLAWQMRDMKPEDIKSFQVPVAGFGTSSDGQSYVRLDDAKVAELKTALRQDSVLDFFNSLG